MSDNLKYMKKYEACWRRWRSARVCMQRWPSEMFFSARCRVPCRCCFPHGVVFRAMLFIGGRLNDIVDLSPTSMKLRFEIISENPYKHVEQQPTITATLLHGTMGGASWANLRAGRPVPGFDESPLASFKLKRISAFLGPLVIGQSARSQRERCGSQRERCGSRDHPIMPF